MNDEILVVNQDDLDKVLSGERNLEAFDLEYADLSSADFKLSVQARCSVRCGMLWRASKRLLQ